MRVRLSIVLVLVFALAGIYATPALTKEKAKSKLEPLRSLRIMLTNDDGIKAPWLGILRDQLCKAGHRVTVVAPATNQSSTGASLTPSGNVAVARETYDCNGVTLPAWGVSGRPADTVWVGLFGTFQNRKPDLVVSGMNRGHNMSATITHSGTVGAAITASELGIPAIAASIGVSLKAAQLAAGSPETTEAAPYAARRLVRLINRLARTTPKGKRLLPAHTILNYNYPVYVDSTGHHNDSRIKSTKFSRIWQDAMVPPAYEEQPDGSLKVLLDPNDLRGAPRNTEVGWFNRLHPVVALIGEGKVDAPLRHRKSVRQRLGGLVED